MTDDLKVGAGQPAYGSESIVLRSHGRRYRIVREVFSEDGQTTFFDETSKDWVRWQGEYKAVETLAEVDSVDAGREFMIALTEGKPDA